MFRQILLSFLTVEEISKVSQLNKEMNKIVDCNKNLPKGSPEIKYYFKPILSSQYGDVFDQFALKSKQKFKTVKDLSVWHFARAKWLHRRIFVEHDLQAFVNKFINEGPYGNKELNLKVQ